ncbi:SDR family NAD(P)-dependent oxidoreductase [Paraferrimonas sp. SM1919]|uniref:SDR family NAD(P)-dependent oxidoreductase n=1 Tax=Paraferrimonas sp. SM1919 TaxID=2662263 RepID=UPI0013D72EAB|nr:SDR family oxidoreductase [Paraferrimonas sp. SM1919]
MFDVTNKVMVITGAASGIGLALCKHFSQQGAVVCGLDLNTCDELSQLDAIFYECNVTQESQVESVLAAISHSHGGIDVLINNAGVTCQAGELVDSDIEDWDRVFSVNIKGVAYGIKHAAKLMTKGGSIINTASLAASYTISDYTPYSISKAGVLQISQSAAMQLGEQGIRVNSVSPGTFLTPMESEDGMEARLTQYMTALQRPGTPDELLGVYQFLASNASSYVNGTDIKVDGGWLAGLPNKAIAKLVD